MAKRRTPNACSFCGKARDSVQRLIAGPGGIFIYDECVRLCNEIIAEGPHSRQTPLHASGSAAGCGLVKALAASPLSASYAMKV